MYQVDERNATGSDNGGLRIRMPGKLGFADLLADSDKYACMRTDVQGSTIWWPSLSQESFGRLTYSRVTDASLSKWSIGSVTVTEDIAGFSFVAF